MSQKIQYLRTCIRKSLMPSAYRCPSCGAEGAKLVQRKYLVSSLRRCTECSLQFRAPTTTEAENASFYQSDYTQGFTTDMPDDQELQKLKDSAFVNSNRDYTRHINLLRALGCKPGDKILDFGCSWGYGSWQLKHHGFNVKSIEISQPRGTYARTKLGVECFNKLEDIKDTDFDVFFSSHVLEHVPSVAKAIDYARSKLRPGGWFVGITPNGSEAFRHAQFSAWNQLWGMVHPNFLDDVFYRRAFSGKKLLLASNPYPLTSISSWANNDAGDIGQSTLEGDELLAVVKGP